MKKFLLSLVLVLTVLSVSVAYAIDSPDVTPNTAPPTNPPTSPKTADVSVVALAGAGAACAAVAVYSALKARNA